MQNSLSSTSLRNGEENLYSVPHGAVGSNARPDHSMLRSCSSETRMQPVHEHLKIESHALNGPTVKAVLRDPNLIIDTIEAMAPVYALMEQGRYQL
mmetsp:Transcript_29707/g.72319  ORF Transcript_29707/g.72319 Transcript_29707/m.72319 type:complete len:96 (+) Transcript_29707:194-481(+)